MNTNYFILLISILLLTCSGQKSNDYKDNYVLKTLADNIISSQIDPTTACSESMDAMRICFGNSTDLSGVSGNETTFITTISAGQSTTYTGYCSNLIVSAPFINQSNAIKACFFECDESYWNTRSRLNICTYSSQSMVTELRSDPGTISCKRDCLTPTNNNP